MKDIFDLLTESDEGTKEDIFDRISAKDVPELVDDLFDKVQDRSNEVKEMVREELSKIKPIEKVIERLIERPIIKTVQVPTVVPPPKPQKIKEVIKETIVKEVVKEDKAEKKRIAELEKEIADLKEKLKNFAETLPFLHGGSGVIGIPPPEGNNGKFLTVVENKQVWGNAGITSGTFTITNNTPTYSFDPTSDTVDTLYQVVATLIRKLQGEI